MTSALEGITVLDMTRMGPGPFCTMVLGDLGAEVIRIEEPGPPTGRRAEQSTNASTASTNIPGGMDRYSKSNPLNRNKKSLGLNLKSPEARAIFHKLAEKADVVVEGFRPGVTSRLGVDYDSLQRINPGIIYCSITGYGQDGPYRDLPGHDVNYIATAGALSLIGEKDGPPVIPPAGLLADFASGSMNAVIGIMAALLARQKTGRGQFVDISMADGVVALLGSILAPYFAGGPPPARGVGPLSGAEAFYATYRTKDGKYLSLGCLESWFWANLCRALGREDLIPLQTDESRRAEVVSAMRETFAGRTRDEWFEHLRKSDIAVAKVNTADELEQDPHLRHRQMVIEFDDPEKGKVKQIGFAVKLSDTPGSIRNLAPQLGEHTDDLLQGLGYAPERIRTLRQAGIIK